MTKFEKISYKQFEQDAKKAFPKLSNEEIRQCYDDIKLPVRATKGSAGYDFFSPFDLFLVGGTDKAIPTGIRCQIDDGYFLMCVPKSGLGFKYRLQLSNTVGIIDADYYNANNEGHIQAKMFLNKPDERISICKGDGIMQGIFVPFGVTDDDSADGVRIGGFGSTSRRKSFETAKEYLSEEA